MADPRTMLESLIEQNGGVLVRQRKHKVYRFPNGATFVVASTPECPLAYDNALAHLKRLLGIYPPDRGAPGTRRNKRLKQKAAAGSKPLSFESTKSEPVETWKDKLLMAAIQLPEVVQKQQLRVVRKPLTFEQRMLRAGVRKLEP
jgi:hypothetical protein